MSMPSSPESLLSEVGYPSEIFIIPPRKDFECPLCLCVFNNPISCPNGHTFCSHCLDRCLRSSTHCPYCREQISYSNLSRNLIVRNIIDGLDVCCPHSVLATLGDSCQDTCKWTGRLGGLRQHLETECLWEPVTCPLVGCADIWARRDIKEHVAICVHRLEACQRCGHQVKQRDMHAHEMECGWLVPTLLALGAVTLAFAFSLGRTRWPKKYQG